MSMVVDKTSIGVDWHRLVSIDIDKTVIPLALAFTFI
jgi:hypothetical protein